MTIDNLIIINMILGYISVIITIVILFRKSNLFINDNTIRKIGFIISVFVFGFISFSIYLIIFLISQHQKIITKRSLNNAKY